MGILYQICTENAMHILQNKEDLDAMRGTNEIVIPVGDRDRNIGWTIVPLSEYVRARYIQ